MEIWVGPFLTGDREGNNLRGCFLCGPSPPLSCRSRSLRAVLLHTQSHRARTRRPDLVQGNRSFDTPCRLPDLRGNQKPIAFVRAAGIPIPLSRPTPFHGVGAQRPHLQHPIVFAGNP